MCKSEIRFSGFTILLKNNLDRIAITPSWKVDCIPHGKQDDPITPTMQIVESKNGCYQVIWDDVPVEDSPRMHQRRSSSASHSLKAVSSTATRGLERVNSKLTDWSGTWNSPSDSFKPTIVVFPDKDGRRRCTPTQFEYTLHDDQDMAMCVPPNSQFTSAAPSRLPSRQTSAPISRATSREGLGLKGASQAMEMERFMALNPEVSPPLQEGENQKLGSVVLSRGFSDAEHADCTFRGHKDSVAIARGRLVRGGLFSGEGKRMCMRSCASSVVGDVVGKEGGLFVVDDDDDGDDGDDGNDGNDDDDDDADDAGVGDELHMSPLLDVETGDEEGEIEKESEGSLAIKGRDESQRHG